MSYRLISANDLALNHPEVNDIPCVYADLPNGMDGEHYIAIKALEQEPCEDCVSRAEVVDELNRLGRNAFKDDTDYDNFFAFLDSLPSVTPMRKKGKWLVLKDEYGDVVEAVCSCCDANGNHKWKYCHTCGAEMEVEE